MILIDVNLKLNLKVALQRAEMRMVRWMCNVKVKDRVPSKELRERLGTDYIILILQQNTGHGQRLCKKIVKHAI